MIFLQANPVNYGLISSILAVLVIGLFVFAVRWTKKEAAVSGLPSGDYISGWAVINLRSVVVMLSLFFALLEAIVSASTPGYSSLFGLGHVNTVVRFAFHTTLNIFSGFMLMALPVYVTKLTQAFKDAFNRTATADKDKAPKTMIFVLICIIIIAILLGVFLKLVNLLIIASGLHEFDYLRNFYREYILRMSGMEAYYKATVEGWCIHYHPLFKTCPDAKSASTDLLMSILLVGVHYLIDMFIGLNVLLVSYKNVMSSFEARPDKNVNRKINKNEYKQEITKNPEVYINRILQELKLSRGQTKKLAKEAYNTYKTESPTSQAALSSWLADTMETIEYYKDTESKTLSPSQKKKRFKQIQADIYDFFRSGQGDGRGFGITISGFKSQ